MNKRAKSNSIRIISGQWRGRKLEVLDAEGLRPTTDRVRETLFNWLMYDIAEVRCLDLFAGTGALGIESLSRGASFVEFIEKSKPASQAITLRLSMLKVPLGRASVKCMDADKYLQAPPNKPYDVVFLDPPFALDLLPSAISLLSEPGWLSPNAFVYIEQPIAQERLSVPEHWVLHRNGQAGLSKYSLYSLNETSGILRG